MNNQLKHGEMEEVTASDYTLWTRRGDSHNLEGYVTTDEGGNLCFYRDISPYNGILRNLGGFAIDESVLLYLEARGITQLSYGVQDEDKTYMATTEDVRTRSFSRTMGRPPRPTHIMPLKAWDLIEGRPVYKFESPVQVTIEANDVGA